MRIIGTSSHDPHLMDRETLRKDFVRACTRWKVCGRSEKLVKEATSAAIFQSKYQLCWNFKKFINYPNIKKICMSQLIEENGMGQLMGFH